MVVKALNEIQSPEQQSVTGTPPVNKPSANPQQPLAQLSAESDLLGEDDFNLFSKAPSHPLSIDESIPEEPFLRVEPAAPAPDREAEFLIRLPANSVDASQNDERPLEALPPAPLFAQMTEAPQPEGGEDQTATAKWLEAASGEASQSIPASTSESAIEVNTAAQAEEYAAAAPNYGKVMNHQLEATSVEYLQQAESLRRQQIPREDLAARVCAAEMALYHAKAEAEHKGKTIEALRDLNGFRHAEINDPEISSRVAAYELAFRMQSAAPELISLTGETKKTRDAKPITNGASGSSRATS